MMDGNDLEGYRAAAASVDLNTLVRVPEKNLTEAPNKPERPYKLNNKGVATIDVNGPITKYQTSFQNLFGGTSTVETTKTFRAALRDPDVKSILLNVDSPGGTFLGTSELTEFIGKVAAKKPVIVFANGSMCSGAYMLASMAGRILATSGTQVGSIGTYAVLYDTSKQAEAQGVKVIVVKAGEHKAVAIDGTKIDSKQIAYVEEKVTEINDLFIGLVSKGRGLEPTFVKKLEAGVFLGENAKAKNLVDEVCDEDRAYAIAAEAAENPESYLRKVDATNPPQKKEPVAPTKGSSSMLTAEQLQQVKASCPGAANITADNAETVMFSELTKTKVKLPEHISNMAVSTYHQRVDLLVNSEKLGKEQADALKASITADSLDPEGKASVKVEDLFKVLETNKPAGLVGEVTGATPAVRTEPGNGGDKTKTLHEEGMQVGQNVQNNMLAARGLQPVK